MKNVSVIIAEDNGFMAEKIKKALEKFSNVNVLGIANDGEEEYKLIKKYKPDLVFSDIEMPKLSGIEVLDKIKKEDPDSDVQVVLVTGKDSTDFIKDAIRLGVFDIVYKPYSSSKIIETLEKFENHLYREEAMKENKIVKKNNFIQKIWEMIKRFFTY